jgi:hypothetical protein
LDLYVYLFSPSFDSFLVLNFSKFWFP